MAVENINRYLDHALVLKPKMTRVESHRRDPSGAGVRRVHCLRASLRHRVGCGDVPWYVDRCSHASWLSPTAAHPVR